MTTMLAAQQALKTYSGLETLGVFFIIMLGVGAIVFLIWLITTVRLHTDEISELRRERDRLYNQIFSLENKMVLLEKGKVLHGEEN